MPIPLYSTTIPYKVFHTRGWVQIIYQINPKQILVALSSFFFRRIIASFHSFGHIVVAWASLGILNFEKSLHQVPLVPIQSSGHFSSCLWMSLQRGLRECTYITYDFWSHNNRASVMEPMTQSLSPCFQASTLLTGGQVGPLE